MKDDVSIVQQEDVTVLGITSGCYSRYFSSYIRRAIMSGISLKVRQAKLLGELMRDGCFLSVILFFIGLFEVVKQLRGQD